MKKAILLITLFGLTAALSAKAAEAKENYDNLCAKCHGAEGKADTTDIPKRQELVIESKSRSTRPLKKKASAATAAD